MTVVGRKADHLRIASGPGVGHTTGTGFEQLRLRHHALPERNLSDVSLETELLGARLGAPLIISAMTGGTAEAGMIVSTRSCERRAAGVGEEMVSARSWVRRAAGTGEERVSATSCVARTVALATLLMPRS